MVKTNKLKEKLDTVFSEYIRRRDSVGGYCACVTCNKVLLWNKGDCGHFIGRGKLSTRFDEMNCNFQCKDCNQYEGGKHKEYLEYMIKRYGEEAVAELVLRSNQIRKIPDYEYKELIQEYKNKIKQLKTD